MVRTWAGILASMLGDLGDESAKLCISFDAVCTWGREDPSTDEAGDAWLWF
jgi:hypothetical protein